MTVSGKARVLGIKKFVTNRRISLKKFKSFQSCTKGAKVQMSAAFSIYISYKRFYTSSMIYQNRKKLLCLAGAILFWNTKETCHIENYFL